MKKFIMSAVLAGAFFAGPALSEASFSMGDRGNDVREMQVALAQQGFSGGTSGVFGPKTLASVQAYQLANRISSPSGNFYGVAGPSTLSSLGISSNSGTVTVSRNTQIGNATTSSLSGIIDTARSLTGTSYLWGGTTTRGFDCSGFIQYSFAQNGQSLPRTVSEMWSAGTSVSSPRVGDLVFFETRVGPSHAGIYLGNNKFIHAGASTGVTISDMNSPYWSGTYLGAKRM